MRTRLTAVIVQDALGFPRAWPVLVNRSRGEVWVYICLTHDDRINLECASKTTRCKDGLFWAANVFCVRDRTYEGGKELSIEAARGGWTNGEPQALLLNEDVLRRLPDAPYRGEGGDRRPAEGLCWREAVLLDAVIRAARLGAGRAATAGPSR